MRLEKILYFLYRSFVVLLLYLFQVFCPLWNLLSSLVQSEFLSRFFWTLQQFHILFPHIFVFLLLVHPAVGKTLFLIMVFLLKVVWWLVGRIISQIVRRKDIIFLFFFFLVRSMLGNRLINEGDQAIFTFLSFLSEFCFLWVFILDVLLVVKLGKEVGVLFFGIILWYFC